MSVHGPEVLRGLDRVGGRTRRNASMRVRVAIAAVLAAFAATAAAQVAPPTPAFRFASAATVGGASVSGTAVVTLTAAGTLGAVNVLTSGVAGQDYSLASGGTCATGTTYFAGQTCTVAVSFKAKYPGVRQGAVVLATSGGVVLGSELLYGTGTGATGVFVPGLISSAAGNGEWIYRGDGGLATASPLFLPMGGAVDAGGDFYLSDSNNQRVRYVSAATGLISTVAGTGTAGFAGDGGPATAAQLNTPADVKLDGAGNFYIADSANHAIRYVNAATGTIYTVAGIGGKSGYTGDGGLATAARLSYPSAVAFDGDHTLYISDTGNNAIRKVDLTTGLIATAAGTGVAGFSGDGGPAIAGQLNSPWGIALASDGSLYIADLSNNRVRRVSAAGVLSTVAGTGTRGYGGDGGPATAAKLNVPAGVAVDVAGNLYVADSGNQLVRKIVAGTISTMAGALGGGAAVDGVPATQSPLDGPYALFLDGPGNLYIADMFHQLVRVVYANQAVLGYPVMRVGKVSAPQPVTLENDGNAALNFTGFNLVSNSALDGGTTTCALGAAVAVDASCVLGVEFAPATTGTLVTGSLAAASNAGNSANVVQLSGQVLAVQPTTTALSSNLNPATLGSAVTFTAVVTNGLSLAATGAVNFFDGTVQIGTVNLDSTGVAAFSTTALQAGSHKMTAVYVGDAQNASATSSILTESVGQPTTTALTSSQNPAVAGVAVTFTATVAGPAGATAIPAGTVTFYDGTTAIGTGTLNASGVATLSATLSGGSHTITANYGGDSSDTTSVSSVLTETMTKAATTAVLTTSNATVFAGVSVTFTATVSRADSVIPGGAVTFLDGGTAIGTATLNAAGVATLATTSLSGGSHSITAAYQGDANDVASSSAAVSETVQPIATLTTLASAANPAIAGAALQLTATVTQSGTVGNGGAFTGIVTFLDGGVAVGTAGVSAAGTATLNVTTLGVGTHSLTASFGGSANYVASASGPLSETILTATTTTALTASANPTIAGGVLTLVATVSGNGGIATGTVTFMDGTVSLGSAVLNAGGVATLATAGLAGGAHTIVAVYGGDAKDSGSTSPALAETVQTATSTTALTSSLNPSTVGASVTFTATVTTNGGAATGAVTFSEGVAVLGVSPVIGGKAVYTTAGLALGTHSIAAAYGGDANDGTSLSAVLAEQVQQVSPVTVSSSANPAIAGTSVTFTATIAAAAGAAATGTVTFKDGGVAIGMATLSAGGVGTLSTTGLAVGMHSITVVYSGDVNNQAATSSALQETVQTAGTTVTLGSSANPSLNTAALTLTATVVGTGGTVTGTVTFQDGATVLGTSAVNASGIATLVVNGLAPGQHPILASYGGDAADVPSTSAALAENIVQATTLALVSNDNPAAVLDAVTYTATVTNGGGTAATGAVVFKDGAAVLGTVTLNAAGVASFTVPAIANGAHTITASYGGDALNMASTSAALSEAVQMRPTTNTLSASSTSLSGGQQVTLISVVRYAGPVMPTGMVTFVSNGITLGTSVVDNTGVATLTVNLLTSAPTVTASYSGDAVYTASTSVPTAITVAPPTQFTMKLAPAAVTVVTQQHSTTMLTLTSLNGFTDTLNLGCVGLPFAATCTFTKTAVALTANGTQTIQVVVDTGSPLTSGSQARLEPKGPGSMAAICWLPGGLALGFAFWKRRRLMRGSLAGMLMALALLGIASAGLTGCGGLHINGTPAGTYTFQVSATGLGSGVSQAIDVTLTVTQ
jgi:hypothetical protein